MAEKTVLDLAQLSEQAQGGVRRLTIDISNEQHAALKKLSAQYDVPMATFIRELLRKWLTEQGILGPQEKPLI